MLSGSGSQVHGQLLFICVLDRDNVIPRAVVPYRVAHLERAAGVAELLRSRLGNGRSALAWRARPIARRLRV